MDLLLSTDLVELTSTDHETMCVSLFMPTHRFGEGVKADRIGWKNLLDGAEARLDEAGMSHSDITALLAPARELHEDALDWQYMSDGLAMFLRPGWHRTFRVPLVVGQLGVVGTRFVLGPLTRLLGDDAHYLLLAISQSQVELWEGSRHGIDRVNLRDVPANLRDVVEPAEPRSDTMARPANKAGRGGTAVFYGHGAGDDQHKQDEVVRFVRQVAAGLAPFLADQTLPLVLVGLEPMLSTYRSVSIKGRILDAEVRKSPDGMSPDDLHAATWPLVAEHMAQGVRVAADALAAARGTGRTLSDENDIAAAAVEGRVDTLFISDEQPCWVGPSDGGSSVIRLDAAPFSHCERLDRSAVETVKHRGTILVAEGPSEIRPGGVEAMLRF